MSADRAERVRAGHDLPHRLRSSVRLPARRSGAAPAALGCPCSWVHGGCLETPASPACGPQRAIRRCCSWPPSSRRSTRGPHRPRRLARMGWPGDEGNMNLICASVYRRCTITWRPHRRPLARRRAARLESQISDLSKVRRPTMSWRYSARPSAIPLGFRSSGSYCGVNRASAATSWTSYRSRNRRSPSTSRYSRKRASSAVRSTVRASATASSLPRSDG